MRRFSIDTSKLERLGSPRLPVPADPKQMASGCGTLVGITMVAIVAIATALAAGWGILRAAGALWSWLGW